MAAPELDSLAKLTRELKELSVCFVIAAFIQTLAYERFRLNVSLGLALLIWLSFRFGVSWEQVGRKKW